MTCALSINGPMMTKAMIKSIAKNMPFVIKTTERCMKFLTFQIVRIRLKLHSANVPGLQEEGNRQVLTKIVRKCPQNRAAMISFYSFCSLTRLDSIPKSVIFESFNVC